MITEKTTFHEIYDLPGMAELFPYLIGQQDGQIHPFIVLDKTLEELNKEQPTWNASDMAYGLNRLAELTGSMTQILYDVYSVEEINEDAKKAQVKVIYFPAKGNTDGRCMLLAAGGAYGSVCSLAESFPVAARLNELGITVFCLNYRVGAPKLFPKPMEDLAAAYTFIRNRAEEFEINPLRYGVGGFSAGGHLAASWGTESLGYMQYGMPKPEVLFLDYPMINISETIGVLPAPIKDMMLGGYFGEDYTMEMCCAYDMDKLVTKEYPSTYIVQAEDDPTVPIWNSSRFASLLATEEIPYCYEIAESGGHGYGLGSGTKAEGWVEKAVKFWDDLEID